MSKQENKIMDDYENMDFLDDWDDLSSEWREKWYNKYFVIPVGSVYRWAWEVPDCIKYFVQRGRRCWSDQDAWAIDYWLVEGLLPMLERLRKNKLGTPSSMYKLSDGVTKDGQPTDEAYKLAEQRWDNILGEIIYGLKCAKKLQDWNYDHSDAKLEKRLVKSVRRSFALMGTNLFDMWD